MASQFAVAQARDNSSDSSSAAIPSKPADVSGKWQVLWTGRLGTEEGALQLQQDGAKLTGTFQDVHGLSSLSGTVVENRLSFSVQFQGQRPFTIRFDGTVDKAKNGGELQGTSQAIGVSGGVFLGHAGEIVHAEHPWTAKRVANQPAQSSEPGSNSSPPARN
jgi:hypothetical protein